MFNNYPSNDNYFAQGALEIAIRVREQEKKLALMNAVSYGEKTDQQKSKSNPIRSLVVSFFALAR